jgi:hypothetical protein
VAPAPKKTVVNSSVKPLDDAVHSDLWKSLNYAVAPSVSHVKNIHAEVDKAVKSLPAKTAEEAREETARIIMDSSRSREIT